jgi:ATP-dependent DNA ligase
MELNYQDRFNLPRLFNLDKKGVERTWITWSEGDTVTTLSGVTGGKMITTTRKHSPKNVGRSNETSGEEQARKEAESKWVKQLDKGYKPKCKEGIMMYERVKKVSAETGGHNINAAAAIRGREMKSTSDTSSKLSSAKLDSIIIPMKAEKWEMKGKCLKYFLDAKYAKDNKLLKTLNSEEDVNQLPSGAFKAYLQRKLDGWRAIGRIQKDSSVVFTSNNGKQYPWFERLRAEFKVLVNGKNILDGLDGEFYTHSIIDPDKGELDEHARFQAITSMCGLARTNPHPLEDQLRFVVFDLVDLSGTYTQEQRFKLLTKVFKDSEVHRNFVSGISSSPSSSSSSSSSSSDFYDISTPFRILLCETFYIDNISLIKSYHDQFALEGYEGVMIRSIDMPYLPKKRSFQIRKCKYFDDAEYPIIGVHLNHGVSDENFVWVLYDASKDVTFNAKPTGTIEERTEMYENAEEYVGKLLTVKFQGYSEDGIPRFPIGKSIRTQH